MLYLLNTDYSGNLKNAYITQLISCKVLFYKHLRENKMGNLADWKTGMFFAQI